MRAFILIAVLLCAVGCSTVESFKTMHIHPSALTQFPPGVTVQSMTVMEDGQVQYEIILPDGTFQTVSGKGNVGNFTAIFNQNDGTEQTTRGQVDAEISPTVTGQGNATGGAETNATEMVEDIPVVDDE